MPVESSRDDDGVVRSSVRERALLALFGSNALVIIIVHFSYSCNKETHRIRPNHRTQLQSSAHCEKKQINYVPGKL